MKHDVNCWDLNYVTHRVNVVCGKLCFCSTPLRASTFARTARFRRRQVRKQFKTSEEYLDDDSLLKATLLLLLLLLPYV
jgi:hypothetical protein